MHASGHLTAPIPKRTPDVFLKPRPLPSGASSSCGYQGLGPSGSSPILSAVFLSSLVLGANLNFVDRRARRRLPPTESLLGVAAFVNHRRIPTRQAKGLHIGAEQG
jgi:hypothetical protein